jgi:hypothetical protein
MAMTRSRRHLAILSGSLVALAAAVAIMAASASAAAPSIEGVWSFNGGTVIVAPDASGQLVGTVSSPTTFANCVHPAGQAMWTDLQASANGMFVGMHQWYHGSGANCTPEPELGPTAFRVLTQSDGSSVLLVCFNHPGSTMPSIAPDGTPSNVNFGCSDSAPVAPVPTVAPTFSQTITLPPSTEDAAGTKTVGTKAVCRSLRRFAIHIREPKNDPFVKLTVYLNNRVFKTLRHGQEITAVINLRGLPKGTYTIRIRARTAAGFIVRGHRTYHTCVPKSPKV